MGLFAVSCTKGPPDERRGDRAIAAGTAHSVPIDHSVIEATERLGAHDIFIEMLYDAELINRLKSSGPFTIFAPTDLAFEGLPYNMFKNILDTDTIKIQKILLYHVVPGEYSVESIMKEIKHDGKKLDLNTLSGDKISLVKEGEDLLIADGSGISATLTGQRGKAFNGIVYSIDQVVMR